MNAVIEGADADVRPDASGPPKPFDIKETLHEEDGKTIIAYEQDCEPIAEAIKRGEIVGGMTPSGEMRKSADIPVIILMEWAKRRGITFGQFLCDDHEWRRFLSDPDNKLWRL